MNLRKVMCYTGKEEAEVNDSGDIYFYAFHDGAWRWSCAIHSGMCHEECWPDKLYPELRPRIKKIDDR